jgi:hypothetical protein
VPGPERGSGAPLDKDRIVRLRTPAPPTGGDPARRRHRFGSGYLIAPERVLTAAHVVAGDGRCEVLGWADLAEAEADTGTGGDAWRSGEVVAPDAALDLAVVAVPGLVPEGPPVRWGRLVGTGVVGWEATGFPAATVGDDGHGRQPEQVHGTVAPLSQEPAQRLHLAVASPDAAGTDPGRSGWAGLSGAAVFVDERLVGVVVADPRHIDRSLTARRIAAVRPEPGAEADADLFAALGRPVLEPVATAEADVRRRGIDAFHEILRDHSEKLPYLAIRKIAARGGRPVPRLSQIYVEQQQEPSPATGSKDEPKTTTATFRETAEEALAHHDHLLVEGRAGIGKSTLLRHLAAVAIDGDGSSDSVDLGVPVWVSARRLAVAEGSFSEALLTAVVGELGMERPDELKGDVFARPPAPGRRWLVLLDALDEVVDATARAGLLAGLRRATGRDRHLYRFVVTSRPATDLDELARRRFAHYRLLPFGREQMLAFVEGWFAARSEQPTVDAARFLEQVDASRISELAATPLLLTMAALLSEQPGARDGLPPSRAHLYKGFVEMLLQEDGRRETRDGFVADWRRQHGPEGERDAHRLFDTSEQLLVELARWQFDDQLLHDSTTFVARQARALLDRGDLPPGVTHEWLCEQLEILLGRTGVVVPYGGDLTFVHETLREFFVATAVARSIRDDDLVRDYIGQWRYQAMREVVLFAVALWGLTADESGGDATPYLSAIWQRGDPPHRGLFIAATALAEGIPAGPSYEAAVVAALVTVACTVDAMEAEEALGVLMRMGRHDDLRTLAHSAPAATRVRIGGILLDLGDTEAGEAVLRRAVEEGSAEAAALLAARSGRVEGLSFLLELVARRSIDVDERSEAAELVTRFGTDEDVAEAQRRLRALRDDRTLEPEIRVTAARMATNLADGGGVLWLAPARRDWGKNALDRSPEVVRTFLSIVDDPAVARADRRAAARAVGRAGSQGLVEAGAFARAVDGSLTGRVRRAVVRGVAGSHEPDDATIELLRSTIGDRSLGMRARRAAALAVGRRGHADPEVVAVLRKVARRRVRTWTALEAAQVLAALGDDRPLVDLARRRLRWIDVDDREAVATWLADHGEAREVRRWAASRRLSDLHRVAVAAVLADRDDGEALEALAADPRLKSPQRLRAVAELAERGCDHALRVIARDAALDDLTRVEAAMGLAGHGEPEVLSEIAGQSGVVADVRLTAARALLRHVPAEGVAHLAALVADPQVDPELQLDAVRALVTAGTTGDAGKALVRLARDGTLTARLRGPVVLAAAESGGDDDLLDVLERLSLDPVADPSNRLRAAELLAQRGATAAAAAGLRSVIAGRDVGVAERWRAHSELEKLVPAPVVARFLLDMAGDEGLESVGRLAAARSAAALDRTEAAVAALRGMVDDDRLGFLVRTQAAQEIIALGSLDDLLDMATARRHLVVEARLRRRIVGELVDAAESGAGVAARRAARALASLPRSGRRVARAAALGLSTYRLVAFFALCFPVALLAVELGRAAAGDQGWLVEPAAPVAVAAVVGLRWALAYRELALELDEHYPARPLPRVLVRGPLYFVAFAREYRLWSTLQYCWPVGIGVSWAVTLLGASGLALVGVPPKVAFYGLAIGLLVVRRSWLAEEAETLLVAGSPGIGRADWGE